MEASNIEEERILKYTRIDRHFKSKGDDTSKPENEKNENNEDGINNRQDGEIKKVHRINGDENPAGCDDDDDGKSYDAKYPNESPSNLPSISPSALPTIISTRLASSSPSSKSPPTTPPQHPTSFRPSLFPSLNLPPPSPFPASTPNLNPTQAPTVSAQPSANQLIFTSFSILFGNNDDISEDNLVSLKSIVLRDTLMILCRQSDILIIADTEQKQDICWALSDELFSSSNSRYLQSVYEDDLNAYNLTRVLARAAASISNQNPTTSPTFSETVSSSSSSSSSNNIEEVTLLVGAPSNIVKITSKMATLPNKYNTNINWYEFNIQFGVSNDELDPKSANDLEILEKNVQTVLDESITNGTFLELVRQDESLQQQNIQIESVVIVGREVEIFGTISGSPSEAAVLTQPTWDPAPFHALRIWGIAILVFSLFFTAILFFAGRMHMRERQWAKTTEIAKKMEFVSEDSGLPILLDGKLQSPCRKKLNNSSNMSPFTISRMRVSVGTPSTARSPNFTSDSTSDTDTDYFESQEVPGNFL